MAAVPTMISDDHAHDRALMRFCHRIAIHGLTIIAHRCSILITEEPVCNGQTVFSAFRDMPGQVSGKPIKQGESGWEDTAYEALWR
jgi:hypothetical protein